MDTAAHTNTGHLRPFSCLRRKPPRRPCARSRRGGRGASPALGGPAVCLCRPVRVFASLRLVHPRLISLTRAMPAWAQALQRLSPGDEVSRSALGALARGSVATALPREPLLPLGPCLPRCPRRPAVPVTAGVSPCPLALMCRYQGPVCPARSAPCRPSPHCAGRCRRCWGHRVTKLASPWPPGASIPPWGGRKRQISNPNQGNYGL